MSINDNADFSKMVERAWTDDAYKARLLEDSTAVLREAGINIPEGITVKVVEDTDNLVHVIMPPKPAKHGSDGNCCGSCT